MRKASIVIGANYGDEGKGTVVATQTKHAEGSVLNVLTNGGAQRGHSILTEDGSMTFQHFGSGTYHGADSYYSRFFILNPMQFVKEYNTLIIKPKHIYRDKACRWSTPYDSMANMLMEASEGKHGSCGMGIWNTVRRWDTTDTAIQFDEFIEMDFPYNQAYLDKVKKYYEKMITIPSNFYDIWDSDILKLHFIEDCKFMAAHTKVKELSELTHDNLIFENGQGLLLCDTGKDTYDTTPSNTGILYSLGLLKELKDVDVTAHYVTRPYLTRHGDGEISNHVHSYGTISKDVKEDRTNHYNQFQGHFRYGLLDIAELRKRIFEDARGAKIKIELTHCDEMDRVNEFKRVFGDVNIYDSPIIK